MTRISGLFSASASGLDIDLFTGLVQPSEPAEVLPLKHGNELAIFELPLRPKAYLHRMVGNVSLQPSLIDGEYDGYYGINANLQGLGIVSNGLRAIVRRVMEQDVQFNSVSFLVANTNSASRHVAESVGAVQFRMGEHQSKFVLTGEQFLESQVWSTNHAQ
jgi:hypothetical protein